MNIDRIYDNAITDDILSILQNDCDITEELKNNQTYDYYYCLSHMRENLFIWYPFKNDSSILEIGGDFGQLTKVFCEKVSKVVSVETSYERAEIIKKRTDSDNLEVLVSDFSDIKIDEKFDYIVLCNVFEYAKNYNNSQTPFRDYLKYLKTFLKENGVILIAISNRLGLKYFAGYKEEHVNQYFSGIDDFSKIDNVQTFSKNELENIVESAGFENFKLFYIYPDHNFPDVINTDEFVNKIPYERLPNFIKERARFFREDLINQIFSENEISQYFANSFLIEIRNDKESRETDKLKFVKINSERKKEFRTCTYIQTENEKTEVIKIPASSFSRNHILKMYENSKESFGKIRFLENSFDGERFKYNYLTERSFEKILIDAIFKNDKNEFYKLLSEYYEALFYNSFLTNTYCKKGFLEIFKEKSDMSFHCQKFTNLDVIFSNLFIIDEEFVSIDYEWIFNFPIPLEYVFFRVINHHRLSNPLFRDFITVDEVFDYFDLDTGNLELFNRWEKNFQNYVFKGFSKPKPNIITKNDIDRFFNKDFIKNYDKCKKENKKLKNTVKKQNERVNASFIKKLKRKFMKILKSI